MSQVYSCNKGPQTGLDVLGDRLSYVEINKKQDSGLNIKFLNHIPLRHFPDQRIPTGHDEILLSLRGGISFVAELLGHESVQLVEMGKAGLCAELACRVPATYFWQRKPHVLDQLMLGVVRFFNYHGCWSLKLCRHGNVPVAIVEARRLYIRGPAEVVTKQSIEAFFSNYNVEEITIPVAPRAQYRNGFAFVSLKTAIEAKDAIENLSGTDLLGRRVFIEHAGRLKKGYTSPSSTSRYAPSSNPSKSSHVALRSPKREGTSGRLETAPVSSKGATRVVIKIEDDDNDPHEAADRGQSFGVVQEAAVHPVKKENKEKAVALSRVDMSADTLSSTQKADKKKSCGKPEANTLAEASNREEIAPKTPDETDEKRKKRKRSDQREMHEEFKRDHKRQKKDKKDKKDKKEETNKREKRREDVGQEARDDACTGRGSTKEPGKSRRGKKRSRKNAVTLSTSNPKTSAHEVEPPGANSATDPTILLPRARTMKQADHQDRQPSASPLLSKRHDAFSKVPAQPSALPLSTITRPQPTISPGQQKKVTKRVYAADVDKDLLQEEVDKNKFLQDALEAVGLNELDCRKIQLRVLKKGDSMENAIARVCPGVHIKKRAET